MSTFEAGGHTWKIAVNVPTIKDVRELDVDLADAGPDVIEQLERDPVLLVDVLWVLCRDQAKTLSVTDQQFGEALVGDPIGDATTALIEAIVDFSHGRRKSLLLKAMEKAEEVQQKGTDLALAKLDDPELITRVVSAIQDKVETEVEAALTQLTSATNSPDKSEST